MKMQNKQKSSTGLDESSDNFEEFQAPKSKSLITQKLAETEFKDTIVPKSVSLIDVKTDEVKAKVQKVDTLLSGLKNKYN